MTFLPHTFDVGEVASSSEVNENMQAIEARVGASSTESRLAPPGDILLGPRSNVQLSGESDTSSSETNKYFHIGWNADLYNDGADWKYRRIADGEEAFSVRVGNRGFEVYGSSYLSGDLDNQITKLFRVAAVDQAGRDFVYVRDSFVRVDAQPDELSDYRLTTVLYDTPKVVYEQATIWYGTKYRQARDYGVPNEAVAVLLYAEGVASSYAVQTFFKQKESSPTYRKGFRIAAGAWEQGAGQGIVPLGLGSHAGKFIEERTGQWNSASLYIQGYLI